MLVKNPKSIAENIVGKTRFFLLKINNAIQIKNTINLIINSEFASTPAGNINILPSSAARIE